MIRKIVAAALACTALSSPALAQTAAPDTKGEDNIVVTAARTILPPNALPLTVDVIGKEALDQQVLISGSVTDAVATLTPSFSPTRQKLSGAGETLRGRSPLYAINGIPQSTPLRDGSRDGFFIDRVEVIYGSNALQGIGGTGGIVNQVTIGAPKTEGVSGRLLLQGTADNEFSEAGMGGKAAGLVQYRAGRFDASVGAAYEVRGIFRDGEGRPVGINLTQGETQDSKTLSLFGRFGYEVTDTMRLDLIAQRCARHPARRSRREPHRKPGAVVDRQQPWRREFRRPDFLEPHPRHLRRRTQSDRDLPGRPDRAGRNAVRSIAEPQPQIWRQAQL